MAHPNLARVINRTLLAASTAALVAGPLAAVGSAQTLDTLTQSTTQLVDDPTCDEAIATKDLEIIAEFCEEDELSAPLAKATEEARARLEAEAEATAQTVEQNTGVKAPSAPSGPTAPAPSDDDGGSGGEPTTVLPSAPSGTTSPSEPRKVRNSGEQPQGISDDGAARGEAAKTNGARGSSYGYSADGPNRPGLYSNSSLTLQPFAAPLVTGPALYDLPQVAQQLFGLGDAADGAATGSATATAASATTPAGYTATPADPTGWLAATATGLIMLVGAAHAVNGGRTPKRQKA